MQKNVATLHRRITIAALEFLLKRCERGKCDHHVIQNRLLYIPASSLPYHISGYTTRTHEVIRALTKTGVDVRVVTRPGYPWDRGDRVQDTDKSATLVDNVVYNHVRSPSKHRPLLMFAVQAAKALEKIAIREKVSVIHAASNHENALPALLTARRLGIPFQYEMRGLWELTRASRMADYENSAGFLRGLELEGFVARNANRIFAISEQLKKYSQERWNIPSDHFDFLPNCVDLDRFRTTGPKDIEANTIGYAGSLISYEGLDTLVEAVGVLVRREIDVHVNILGDGEARGQLEDQVKALGLSAYIRFWGRVSPDSAREILRKSSLVCIPRKPYKVCEIVPPIKLVEALAICKPVIVPDLPVFRDELGREPAGWFFKAGDAADLARVIQIALKEHEMRSIFAARARQFAGTQRCWRDYVVNMVPEGEIV